MCYNKCWKTCWNRKFDKKKCISNESIFRKYAVNRYWHVWKYTFIKWVLGEIVIIFTKQITYRYLLSHTYRGIIIQQRGPPRGVPVPLFPWNKFACSPKIENLFSYVPCSPILSLFPCSPQNLTFVPLFPRNKCPVFPVPQNPWEGLNKTKPKNVF